MCSILRLLNSRISSLSEENEALRQRLDQGLSGPLATLDQSSKLRYNVSNKKEVNEVFAQIFRKTARPLDLEDVLELITISYQQIIPPHILDAKDFIRRKLIKACTDGILSVHHGTPGRKGCFYVLGPEAS